MMYETHLFMAGLVRLSLIAPVLFAHLVLCFLIYRVLKAKGHTTGLSLLATLGAFTLAFTLGQLALYALGTPLIEQMSLTLYDR